MTVRIKNLRHQYGVFNTKNPVLSIDNFSVAQGEQALIVGSSASGKSTMMDILAGSLAPDTGEIWIDDRNIYNCPPAHRQKLIMQNIGYMSRPANLNPNLTLIENIDQTMIQTGRFPANLSHARAKALLSQMDLFNLMDIYPRSLSKSQIIKATALRSIAAIPKMILADEPTAQLEEVDGDFVLSFLQEISRWYNATLIVATRNPTLASKFENTYYLYQGQLEKLAYLKSRRLKTITKTHELLKTQVI